MGTCTWVLLNAKSLTRPLQMIELLWFFFSLSTDVLLFEERPSACSSATCGVISFTAVQTEKNKSHKHSYTTGQSVVLSKSNLQAQWSTWVLISIPKTGIFMKPATTIGLGVILISVMIPVAENGIAKNTQDWYWFRHIPFVLHLGLSLISIHTEYWYCMGPVLLDSVFFLFLLHHDVY